MYVFHDTSKTATIHGCCLIIFYTPPTIQANIASSWSTYTKVSALYWYLYYCGYHYNIYANILIRLYRTAGPSRCLFFVIQHTFVVRKTGKNTTIRGCCLIVLHTPPKIWANVASLISTYTKVSALYWYLYYCGLVYRIDKIFRTIQGDCFL